MPIPKYEELLRPLLARFANGDPKSISVARAELATELELTDEDLAERLPSGTTKTFVNRIGWATLYLTKALALQRVNRGTYRITPRGTELLNTTSALNDEALATFPEFRAFIAPPASASGQTETPVVPSVPAEGEGETPEELIESATGQLRRALVDELRERIAGGTPAFFEQLVVDVMVAMGYGGTHAEAAQRLGKSGDGGIDGVIREDRLGLDVIYLQAKRWEASIGRPEIQKFVGALQGHHASRGVFITSSSFTKDASEYAASVATRVVLVDGGQLAQLMIDYGVGVDERQTFTIHRVDEDYFSDGDTPVAGATDG